MEKSFGYTAAEYVFGLLAAVALAFNLFNAFVISDEEKKDLGLLLVLAAAVMLMLHLCFFSRVTKIVSAAVLAAAAGMILFNVLLHLDEVLSESTDALIPYLFFIVTVCSCVAVFFAAKTRLGSLLLFVLGCAALFYLEAEGFELSQFAYFVFVACAAVLFFRANYLKRRKDYDYRYAGVSAMTAAGAAIALAALIGAQVFFYGTGLRLLPGGLNIDSLFSFSTAKGSLTQAGFQSYNNQTVLGRKLSPDNTAVMEVKADAPFYLKGCTYTDYTGTSWSVNTALNTNYYGDAYFLNSVQSVAEWYRFFWMFGYAYKADPDAFSQMKPTDFSSYYTYYENHPGKASVTLRRLQVTYRQDKIDNIFLPGNYLWMSTDEEQLHQPVKENYGEPELPKGTSYTLEYPDLSLTAPETQNILENDRQISGEIGAAMRHSAPLGDGTFYMLGEAESEYYNGYSEFIEQTYTDAGNTTQRVKNLAASITKGCVTDYDKVLAVKNYLSNHYRYTLSPRQPAKGRDFVDYFLFDGREGYCEHFASAMTVLLRCAGVPCRYVAGFVAPAESDNGIYEVTANQAHAWVEVYSRTLGFYTVEATPGFAYLSAPAQSRNTSSRHSSSSTPSSSLQSSSAAPSSGTSSVSHSVKTADRRAKYDFRRLAAFIPLFILALAAVLFAVKMLFRVIWRRRLNRLDRKGRVIALYGYYLRVLSKLGLARGPADTPFEFADAVGSSMDFGRHDFKRVTGIFVKARYGPDALTKRSTKTFRILTGAS